jgi:tRNA (guanine-N7-)-methyltransferase
LADDALLALNSFEDQSVDVLYILNPDPWPKIRHHKRRVVIEKNLKVFARVLKDGGTMIQTTDVDELAEWMVCQTTACPAFEWQAQSPKDWQTAPDNWLATRYESKGGKAGRQQTYLVYKRLPRV